MKLLKGLVIIPFLFLGACSSDAETVKPTVAPTAQTATKESVALPEYSMTEDERVAFCGAVQATIDARGSIDWSKNPDDEIVESEFSKRYKEISQFAPESHREIWAFSAEINARYEQFDFTITEEEKAKQLSGYLSLKPMMKEECGVDGL